MCANIYSDRRLRGLYALAARAGLLDESKDELEQTFLLNVILHCGQAGREKGSSCCGLLYCSM
jgi:hypothetical protein